MKIVAIDIGGTSIKAGLWDGTKLTRIKHWSTQATSGGLHVMERVKELIGKYHDFDAIGISTAGEVNTEDGSIFYANENIPGYTGMPVKKIMEAKFQVPVAVENDVNAAAMGEMYFGAAKGCSDFLCLTYGTGVGGCIVMNHNVYRGSSYSAGGFGGMVLYPEKKAGTATLEGCYEKCASTTALVKRVKMVDASYDNGKKIFAAMNDEHVKRELDGWIDDICTGLVTLIYIFNPSTVILGGGIMEQEYLIKEINRKTKGQLSSSLKHVQIFPARLGNLAGMMGAVSLFTQKNV